MAFSLLYLRLIITFFEIQSRYKVLLQKVVNTCYRNLAVTAASSGIIETSFL